MVTSDGQTYERQNIQERAVKLTLPLFVQETCILGLHFNLPRYKNVARIFFEIWTQLCWFVLNWLSYVRSGFVEGHKLRPSRICRWTQRSSCQTWRYDRFCHVMFQSSMLMNMYENITNMGTNLKAVADFHTKVCPALREDVTDWQAVSTDCVLECHSASIQSWRAGIWESQALGTESGGAVQNGRMDPVFRASRIALMISYALARCCFSARRIGDFIPKNLGN